MSQPVIPPHRRVQAPGTAEPALSTPADDAPQTFGYALASWSQRVAACLLDVALFAIPGWLLLFVAVGSHSGVSADPDTGVMRNVNYYPVAFWILLIVFLAGAFVYFTLLTGSPEGQTLGKRVVGIAVRDSRVGGSIGNSRAFLRILLVSVMIGVWIAPIAVHRLWPLQFTNPPFGVAIGGIAPLAADLLWPLWDPYHRAWHDLASRSVVVRVGDDVTGGGGLPV